MLLWGVGAGRSEFPASCTLYSQLRVPTPSLSGSHLCVLFPLRNIALVVEKDTKFAIQCNKTESRKNISAYLTFSLKIKQNG